MADVTLFWHDYETWGVDPRRDRPVQFAGVRTNTELEVIGEPVDIFCTPTADFLPQPDAVLVTGITPQAAREKGVNEAEFFARIHNELSRPGTCGVGYNSIRFDDEVTRFGFYRNFYDPYGREWQNGNSRWDILDLVRMAYALRPEGINWPEREEGLVSFRLEELTRENGISHEGAHDALSDVMATVGMARLIRKLQPRLFDFYFELRRKNRAAEYLNLKAGKIELHVSGMYGAGKGCIAPVVPLIQHPVNKNEIIVYDLRENPDRLLAMNVEEMEENLYKPGTEMLEGEERIALKGVHINKSPALAPVSTLSAKMAERWQVDWNQAEKHREKLLGDRSLVDRLVELYRQRPQVEPMDADVALYDGFIRDSDRRLCDEVLASTPQQLMDWVPEFSDPRLDTIYARYRARNWPELLSEEEKREWQQFCKARVLDGEMESTLTLQGYRRRIEQLLSEEQDERNLELLRQLENWPAAIGY